jgi:hypothetical protein
MSFDRRCQSVEFHPDGVETEVALPKVSRKRRPEPKSSGRIVFVE